MAVLARTMAYTRARQQQRRASGGDGMAHVVSTVQYMEGVIRDAAFFLHEIQRYNNSLASWLQ